MLLTESLLLLPDTAIDDYAKDGGPGEVWLLCNFYHECLRTWIKIEVCYFSSYGFETR